MPSQAWTRLQDVEVILIGDEPGIPEAAREFGVRNVPEVKRDEKGIPLVSSVMEIGHAHSDSPMLCYANADMILMSDLVAGRPAGLRQAKDFLLVGQRWNLDLTEPFDFSGDWESRLRADVAQHGKFYSPWGIDYFVFPRHLYTEVPDFTIGRPAWDNWMVYHARTTFGMAIDASRDVLVVHQNHDYSHLPGNKPPYGSEVAKSNLAKAGGRKARLQHPGYQPRTCPGTHPQAPGPAGAHAAATGADVHQRRRQRLELGNVPAPAADAASAGGQAEEIDLCASVIILPVLSKRLPNRPRSR